MKKLRQLLAIFLAVTLFAACSDKNEVEDANLGNKEGILLVTFGSTFPTPRETFKKVDAQFKKTFNEPIYWGYTSKDIRNKLLKRENLVTDSPTEALEKMKKDGFSKIAIQSLHIIPGLEFDELQKAVATFLKENKGIKITVGVPLMNSDEDMGKLANILVKRFNDKIKDNEAVIFMGHGSGHKNNDRYARLQKMLTPKAKNFYIGTVESNTTGPYLLKDVVPLLKKKTAIKKIILTPLMSIAGDHANNDMDGAEDKSTVDNAEKSWKWQLRNNASYGAYGNANVSSVLVGLGTYPEVVNIWISHLKTSKALLK